MITDLVLRTDEGLMPDLQNVSLLPDVSSMEPEEAQKALLTRIKQFTNFTSASNNLFFWVLGEVFIRFNEEYKDYNFKKPISLREFAKATGVSKSTIDRAETFREGYSEDVVKQTSCLPRDAMFEALKLDPSVRNKLLINLAQKVFEEEIKRYEVMDIVKSYLEPEDSEGEDEGGEDEGFEDLSIDKVIKKGKNFINTHTKFYEAFTSTEEIAALNSGQKEELENLLNVLNDVEIELKNLLQEANLEQKDETD